jgi:hypothetical protein
MNRLQRSPDAINDQSGWYDSRRIDGRCPTPAYENRSHFIGDLTPIDSGP